MTFIFKNVLIQLQHDESFYYYSKKNIVVIPGTLLISQLHLTALKMSFH